MIELLAKIDHTFLKIEHGVTPSKLLEGAKLVIENSLRSFIVPPQLVYTVCKAFPSLIVGTVVGYPLGFETLSEKIFASQQAREDGAREVDIVLDLFALVNNNFKKIEEEVSTLSEVGRTYGLGVKFILEISILGQEQIQKAVEICVKHKPLAIKSGTGYHRPPVTPEDIRHLASLARGNLLVKAAGGIDSYARALELMSAGADIIGTSHTEKIIAEMKAEVEIPPDPLNGSSA